MNVDSIINGVVIFNYSHFDSATFTSVHSFVIMDLNAKILHSQGEYTTKITDNGKDRIDPLLIDLIYDSTNGYVKMDVDDEDE